MKQWKQSVLGCMTAGLLLMTSFPVFAADISSDPSGKSQSVTEGSTFDDGTLTYTILKNMQVSVTGCITTATNISIMPKIDGYTVVSIGDQAFAGCSALQSVTMPNGVTEIGDGAFQSCTSLQSVTLSNSITEIPDGAFLSCSALTDIQLGDQITKIGRMAFAYCSSLTDMEIPDSVTEFGEQTFMGCSSLESITLPETLETLSAYMFQNCSALESFSIPDTMTDLGYLAFVGCQNLKTIAISANHPTYQLQDGILYSKDGTELFLYPAGKTETSFTVPDGVKTISDGAFFAAPLQSVTLPEGLEWIGSGAFDYCTSLTNITIPESVTVIQDHAFSDCESLSSVLFAGDEEATDNALQIGSYAFFCCEQLMDVTLPKRVTQIGDFAFGVTEQQKVNADGSTSDETENIAVSGFLLTGYEGAAAKYVSSSRSNGIRINFKSLQIPWVKIVSISLGCTAGLVLIFLLVRMIKKKRLSAADKEALEAAEQERKIPLSQREPDPEPEEPEEPDYVSILEDMSHSQMTHQFGHGTLPQESETDSNAESTESSETTSKSTK